MKAPTQSVFGVSTDNTPSLGEFAKKLSVSSSALLIDLATRKTAEAYGVVMPERGIAKRATFVVDKQGKITFIEERRGGYHEYGRCLQPPGPQELRQV